MFVLKNIFLVVFLSVISVKAIANITILTVDSQQKTAQEIGYQLGIKIKENFPYMEYRYDNYLNFLLSDSRFKQLNDQANLLKQQLNSDNRLEINAVADVLSLVSTDRLGDGKLSVNEFWLLQFLSDLTTINKGVAISVFDPIQKTPIIARNINWKNNSVLNPLHLITIYKSKKNTFVTVGFAGMLGVINGFNRHGLFVSLINSSPQLQTAIISQNHQSVAFTLKNTLKKNTDISTASRFLHGRHYPHDQQILLADKKNVQVLESPANIKKEGTVRLSNSPLVNRFSSFENKSNQFILVGCFVLITSPKNCYSSNNYYRWNRLQQLLDSFDPSFPTTNLLTIMQDDNNHHQSIFNDNVLQTLIFMPLNQTLYLYTYSNSESSKNDFQKLQLIENLESKDLDPEMLVFIISDIILIALLGSFFYYKKYKKLRIKS
ncbi:MAG: hypothetical protein Q9M50_13215 [Methylococcales bacterium]|nr:hypothetical protein [Methylococcales bacterium]